MNIVFVCNHFLPRIGGVELSVHHTARALARAGHNVTIVTETPASREDRSNEAYTVERFQVPVVRPITRLFYWREMWRRRRIFRRADALHFHDYTPFIHWYLPLALIIRRPRYGITFHGFEGFPIKLRHKFLRTLCIPFMDVVFGVGNYLKKYYGHRFDAFYIGAPVTHVEETEVHMTWDFFFAGRLEPDTGIFECASAIAQAASGLRRQVTMCCAGEGSLKEAIRSLGNECCHISTPGNIANPAGEYRQSRFVVATGFLAIFDAFASGAPALIPALTPIKRDYLASIPGIGSMAFIAGDRLQLAQVVSDLLDNPDRVEEKVRTARKFANALSWDNIASMYIDAYEKAGPERTR